MPKRGGGGQRYNAGNNGGGGGSRFSALKDYQDEHDDRDRDHHRMRNTTRRVSFKQTLPPTKDMGGMKRRTAEMAIRGRLEDDDDMGGCTTSSKFEDRRCAQRKGSPIPKGKFGGYNKKLTPNSLGWYQVSVQSAQRYAKDDTIRALLSAISPDIFIPHYWRTEKNCVVFFVDDYNAAEKLQQIERNVQMPDGYRLLTRVRSGCPIVSVDEPFKERMKLVMAKRYNAATRALDMAKFHADPDFKDMFCGLFRTPVMSAALEIMAKNIPELEALNLNDNCLSTMESFKDVQMRLPQLKILYLGDNRITSLAHLLVLRQVPLLELWLKGNPMCQRYRDQKLYVSETRRKFPKLLKLDGEDLASRVFDDVMPSAKASFLCDAAGADIIRQFLEQYFIIFDSDNRQPLLDAYHEQAMMSMSLPSASQAGRLNSFWKFNRNLRRLHQDDNYRVRLLKVGRLAVVSTLAEWPKTQHDPQSFSVDLTLFTPKLISFTVAGLFKEFDTNSSTSAAAANGDTRYFQRQYIIVPAGSGFCIRNELIFITSALHAQARSFMKPPTVAPAMLQVQQMVPQHDLAAAMNSNATGLQNRLQSLQLQGPSATSVQIPTGMLPSTAAGGIMPTAGGGAMPSAGGAHVDDATKMQMVQTMSAQSTMNLDWSKKCLEETNWDYNHAAFIFEKLHKENKIPPEAFIK